MGVMQRPGTGMLGPAFMVGEREHGKEHRRPEKGEVNQARCHRNPKQ